MVAPHARKLTPLASFHPVPPRPTPLTCKHEQKRKQRSQLLVQHLRRRKSPEGARKPHHVPMAFGKGAERGDAVAHKVVGQSQNSQVHLRLTGFPLVGGHLQRGQTKTPSQKQLLGRKKEGTTNSAGWEVCKITPKANLRHYLCKTPSRPRGIMEATVRTQRLKKQNKAETQGTLQL